MATIRRLSDADVRAVFESIHNNTPPPPNLHFQVVPVGSDGQKLSPPPYEFEDGLYVLLKPTKKNPRPADAPKVPSSLMELINTDIPRSKSLTWSLSGPQFPKPTAIQQRYCYPRGNHVYCTHKGGALWTMHKENGDEDTEYRLLHVYYSAKRAVNKGAKLSAQGPASKRYKRTPPRNIKPRINRPSTPTSTTSESTCSSFQSSPLPQPVQTVSAARCASPPNLFDERILEIESPHSILGTNFVTPDIFPRFHPVSTGSPIRPRSIQCWESSLQAIDTDSLQLEPTLEELEACWSEPFVDEEISKEDRARAFAKRLNEVHQSIKDTILFKSKDDEQADFLSMFSDWGKKVSQTPLGEHDACLGVEQI